MIPPDKLAESLNWTAGTLEQHGETTWQRVKDWTRTDRIPTDSTRGGGLREAKSDDRIEDERLDAQAARYHTELQTLTQRIEADCARLRRIITITNPARPKHLGSRDLLAAQVAADGWCVSCWRDDQHLHPISLRPSGEPYYTDLCRPCGEWKAANGELPPLDVLRTRHNGGRVRLKAS